MTRFQITHWAAWAPGIESEEQWRNWVRTPRPIATEGAPALRFLPPMQRRRCDQLGRMMLHAAQACCEQALLPEVASVFASRHGPIHTTNSLLGDLAREAPLSPARFSHSVHNSPAGQFSIWAANSKPSMSLAAGAETFAHGFLEALCMLHRQPGNPVLYVSGEESIPHPLSAASDHEEDAHAIAFLLSGEGFAPQLTLELEESESRGEGRALGDSLEFLRWWLSDEATLRIAHETRTWVWRRDARIRRDR